MFVLITKYVKPLEEVERLMAAHQEFLDRFYREGKFIASGPREPRTGGVILADVASELEAMKIVCEDPFFTEKVAEYEVIRFTEKVAEYEVIRFTPTRADERFAPFAGVGA